jgi:hypothetical protein
LSAVQRTGKPGSYSVTPATPELLKFFCGMASPTTNHIHSPPNPLDARGLVRQKRKQNVTICCSDHYDHCDHYWHPLGAGIDAHRFTATLKSAALSEQLRVFYFPKNDPK